MALTLKTQIKPLVCVLLTVMATQAFTATTPARKDATTAKDTVAKGKEAAKATNPSSLPPGYQDTSKVGSPTNTTADEFVRAGRPAGIQGMPWPAPNPGDSAGRFGEWRSRTEHFHEGVDISYGWGVPLKAIAPGKLVFRGISKGYGFSVVVQRPFGDTYSYHHMTNHVGGISNASNVQTGDILGGVSNTQSSGATSERTTMAKHLHFNYGVPATQQSRKRTIQINTSSIVTGSTFKKTAPRAPTMVTDPTPYFQNDLKFWNHYSDKPYVDYLGKSMRSQFNALYKTNLPLGNASWRATRQIPGSVINTLSKQFQGTATALTPHEVAAANSGMVNGMVTADESGFNEVSAAPYVSQQVLASFLSTEDGAKLSTLPPPLKDERFDKMTLAEMVEQIGNKRYGNPDWHNAMLKLSTRAMFTEYLAMTAEENFLDNQNERMTERVELMIAGVAQARLFEYNKKIQAMQIMAEASIVPGVINLPLDTKGDEYVYMSGVNGADGVGGVPIDLANLPSDLQGLLKELAKSISNGEGAFTADAFNTGTSGEKGCAIRSFGTDAAVAASGGLKRVTEMTIREIWESGRDRKVCVPDVNRKSANGKYQHMWYTLGGKAYKGQKNPTGGFVAAFPQYVDAKFTSELQDFVLWNYSIPRSRPILADFLRTGQNLNGALNTMAGEWSSICKTNGVGANAHMAHNACRPNTSKVTYAIMGRIADWHKAHPGEGQKIFAQMGKK